MDNIKYLIIIVLIVIVVFLFYMNTTYEHMTSDEAIKNVASIYNTEKMVLKDLVLTGKLSLGNGFYITSDKNSGLIIGKDGITKQIYINNDLKLITEESSIGKLTVRGTATVDDIVSTNRIYTPSGKIVLKDWTMDSSNGNIKYTVGGNMKFSINNGGISWDNGSSLLRHNDTVRLKTNTKTNDYVFRGSNGTIYGDKSLANTLETGKFTIANATL